MASIQLNFVNQSNDPTNATILIFQKNEADPDGPVVAWQVIDNCGAGDQHPFAFSSDTYIAASDSYGNYTPQLLAAAGQQFSIVATASGDQLTYTGASGNAQDIALLNSLQQGAVNGWIYRDGNELAVVTDIVPGQEALFRLIPTIWIGVVQYVVQGQIIDPAIVSQVNTEISLPGIASADIVMTGGGTGPGATAYVFTLENIVYA